VTSSNDEHPPTRGMAKWIYEQMCRLIEQGVWQDGHPLPSEDELENKPISTWLDGYLPPSEEEPEAGEDEPGSIEKSGPEKKPMSRRTARDAVILLAAIGRVIKHPGKRSEVYMPSMEPHWLAVGLRRPWHMKLDAVAEPHDAEPHPAVQLIPAAGSVVSTRWHEGKDEYTVPEWDCERLGIDTGTKLRMYTLTLLIDDEPILTSTSLVPSDLLDGAVTWQQKTEGELALTGVSTTFSYPTLHSRVPTLDESEPLEPVPGIPVIVAYRQCRITPVGIAATPRRACVVVVARADRVHL
jgi:DNA-binding GntR family transcriptional regulator